MILIVNKNDLKEFTKRTRRKNKLTKIDQIFQIVISELPTEYKEEAERSKFSFSENCTTKIQTRTLFPVVSNGSEELQVAIENLGIRILVIEEPK